MHRGGQCSWRTRGRQGGPGMGRSVFFEVPPQHPVVLAVIMVRDAATARYPRRKGDGDSPPPRTHPPDSQRRGLAFPQRNDRLPGPNRLWSDSGETISRHGGLQPLYRSRPARVGRVSGPRPPPHPLSRPYGNGQELHREDPRPGARFPLPFRQRHVVGADRLCRHACGRDGPPARRGPGRRRRTGPAGGHFHR